MTSSDIYAAKLILRIYIDCRILPFNQFPSQRIASNSTLKNNSTAILAAQIVFKWSLMKMMKLYI